jgi:four helix bundle protein
MNAQELRDRTRAFALEVLDLCLALKADDLERTIGRQLMRAGTGVAANHRAASRARSRIEFASRLAVVVEEADESEFWLDVLVAKGRGPAGVSAKLRLEAVELRSIFASSRATTLRNLRAARAAPVTGPHKSPHHHITTSPNAPRR